MSPTLPVPSFLKYLLKDSFKGGVCSETVEAWNRGPKSQVAAGFAQARLLHEACPDSAGEENQSGFMEELDLSKVLKERWRKGIPNSWPLHSSEIIRHIIKKQPREGEVQTTDETGSGQEMAPGPQRAKNTGLLTQHKAAGKLGRARGPPVSLPLRRREGRSLAC